MNRKLYDTFVNFGISMRSYIAILAITVFLFASCSKNNLSKIPQISSLTITPDSIKAGSSRDTVYLKFHIVDGDGNLGNDHNSTNYDIYLIDNRDSSVTGYFFPYIPSQVTSDGNGIEGDCIVKLLAAFIVPRANHPNGDTVHYEVYVKDQAQNESNHLTTPDIYIRP
jgi:hypothetical protein